MSPKTEMDALVRSLGTWSSQTGPLYKQLAQSIGRLIDEGALRNGAVLPAERKLATCLSVSRSTVVAAYDQLKNEGRLERKQGSGTQVVARHSPGPDREHPRSAPLFGSDRETRALLQAVPAALIDPAAELHKLADLDPALLAMDSDPEGWWDLRAAIASRYEAKGLTTSPHQVLITSGTQQACTLLLGELLQPGDVVLAEAHTWPGLTDVAERLGARCHGIAMDEGGVDTSILRGAIERLRPAAIVVNPHNQNPTGTRLLPHRRRELANIAADYGVQVIEDRVFASLSYDGDVPVPLATHRPDAPLATIDSLSKSIWSGLRVGWIRASTDLIGRLRYAKALDDLGTSIPSQLLAHQLLPRLDELTKQRSEQLATLADETRLLLVDLIHEWTIPEPKGGASLWIELPDPFVPSFVRHAARNGVLLVGDDAFAVSEATNRHIRLPFTAPRDELHEALARLADAWSSFEPQAPSTKERSMFV